MNQYKSDNEITLNVLNSKEKIVIKGNKYGELTKINKIKTKRDII